MTANTARAARVAAIPLVAGIALAAGAALVAGTVTACAPPGRAGIAGRDAAARSTTAGLIAAAGIVTAAGPVALAGNPGAVGLAGKRIARTHIMRLRYMVSGTGSTAILCVLGHEVRACRIAGQENKGRINRGANAHPAKRSQAAFLCSKRRKNKDFGAFMWYMYRRVAT